LFLSGQKNDSQASLVGRSQGWLVLRPKAETVKSGTNITGLQVRCGSKAPFDRAPLTSDLHPISGHFQSPSEALKVPFASIRISNFGEIRQRKLASGEANTGHVAAPQSLTPGAKGDMAPQEAAIT
jgi:hypothetical protein